MRTMLRCLGAWMAAWLLLTAALLGLVSLATTEAWARASLCAPGLQGSQQSRIEEDAAALTAERGLETAALQDAVQDAAAAYSRTLAAWWGELFRSEDVGTSLPLWLDDAGEQALVRLVMEDPGFTPSDANLRRQEARDVVYALEESVRKTVMPLRPAVAELALTMLTQQVSLPQLRQAALIGAGAAAAAGLLLLALVHRAAGSVLLGTGCGMGLMSIPVMLLNVHEMMLQLNPDAAQQADRLLLCLGIPWYGAALALMLTGALILKIKDVRR